MNELTYLRALIENTERSIQQLRKNAQKAECRAAREELKLRSYKMLYDAIGDVYN